MGSIIEGSYFGSIRDVAYDKAQQELNKYTSEEILQGRQYVSAESLKKTDLFSMYKDDKAFNNLLSKVADSNGNVDADTIEFLGIVADASKYSHRSVEQIFDENPKLSGFYLDGVTEENGKTHFELFSTKDLNDYKQAKADAQKRNSQGSPSIFQ